MLQHKPACRAAASLKRSGEEDFLSRLDKAEARDVTARQQFVAYQRSQREPIWTQKASQPVGGRFQLAWKFNNPTQEWTAECEAAFRAAFNKPSDRNMFEAPTGS